MKLKIDNNNKMRAVYLESVTHRLIEKMNETVRICFRYSFLGRITETGQTAPLGLGNSRMLQYLLHFYRRGINCLSNSATVSVAQNLQRELYCFPVKIISIIVITTVMVNAFLLVILQIKLDLWNFLIRVLLLFVATAGLSCEADCPTVKKSSIFLKKTRMD